MEELLLLINPIIDFLTNNPEGVTLAYFGLGGGGTSSQGGWTFTNQPYQGTTSGTSGTTGTSSLVDRFKAMDPALQTHMASSVGSGVAGLFQGIFEMGDARQRVTDTKKEYKARKLALGGVDTSNPFARIRNPYANLEVNKQQAEFQVQRGQQALVDTMSQMRGATGGSGVAALAQAMANQQLGNIQQISANIGQQESENTRLRATGAMEAQTLRGQGKLQSAELTGAKQSVLLDYAVKEYQAAEKYKSELTGAVAGGVGSMASAMFTGGMGGLFTP